jgi:hypothetical protein
MLGPAAGAPLLLLLGPTYGILVNALIYLPFLLWVRTVPFSRKAAPPPLRGFGDVAAAARVVARNRVLLSMTLLAGCASLWSATPTTRNFRNSRAISATSAPMSPTACCLPPTRSAR